MKKIAIWFQSEIQRSRRGIIPPPGKVFPRRLRTAGHLGLVITVPLLLFIALAICVGAGITAGIEGWAYNEIIEHMSPLLTEIVKAITHLGDAATVTGFCLLLFVLPKSRRSLALPVSAAVIISTALNWILKRVFARERPDILRLINETSYSFPSGHAMINASLYIILNFFIFKHFKNSAKRILLSSLCVILAVSIGVSRIYLGVHYAVDILAGWLLGIVVAAVVYSIWNNDSF